MQKERFSEDWTLLQIHRQFSQDEAMKALFLEISKLKFEIGELKSESSELNYQLAKYKTAERRKNERYNKTEPKEKEDKIKTIKQWRKDDFFIQINRELEQVKKTKKRFEKDSIEWRNKYFSLLTNSRKLLNIDANELP